MSFRPWSRWKSERTQPSTLADEVERLAADPRVHRLFQWFSSNERDIAEFQLAIAAIPAPTFAEQARALWLRDRLQSCALATTTDAAGNLLALRPAALGTDPTASPATGSPSTAPAIAVSAHLDTVFPASLPLAIRRENARLLGPGIGDNASGLAALWALAAAFHHVGILTTTPLLFIANVGEEGEGNLRGMRHLYRDHIAPSTAADPTPAPAVAMLIALDGAGNDNIISQALGSRRFEVVITGPGGHSWSDHGAPNPIVAASLLVGALFRIPLPVNPRTTLNVGSIQGGTSINTIPEQAVVKIDLRSSDPARLDDLERQLRQAASDACAETQARSTQPRQRLQHSITLVGERPAGELSPTSPLLTAIRAVDAQLGINSQILRASTDANIPLSLGLEAISIGAGGSGGGAHTVHEWFDPAGRDQALKRIALLVLLLAGLADPQASPQPGAADASASTPTSTESA
jgi:acetylornithine deacetylase/succinyl-diaminopimelate desuccinylase-like protein